MLCKLLNKYGIKSRIKATGSFNGRALCCQMVPAKGNGSLDGAVAPSWPRQHATSMLWALGANSRKHCLMPKPRYMQRQDSLQRHMQRHHQQLGHSQKCKGKGARHKSQWGRALASAGFLIYAGNHRGVPCTIGLSRHSLKSTAPGRC